MVKDPMSYNSDIPPEIMTYNETELNKYVSYENDETEIENNLLDIVQSSSHLAYNEYCVKCNSQMSHLLTENVSKISSSVSVLGSVSSKKQPETTIQSQMILKEETQLNGKIKDMKINFYKNDGDLHKKSACFWCSFDFDNKSFFIPKTETNNIFNVYGCFCTPECATAYLFKEKIDDNIKFERYHLLNKMYNRTQENIKPAPNPYYLLDKYLGNLTIHEYRRLLKTQHHQLVFVEKPMTRILPELHSETENGRNSTFKIKRQSEMSGSAVSSK
jgi:hypothetical protein